MYLLDKLKPFEQKRVFFPKRAKWVGMESSLCQKGTDLPGGSNSVPPGWKSSALTHWPINPLLADPMADRPICAALGSD